MKTPSPKVREWARQLLAAEAASLSEGSAAQHEAIRVCETLKESLTRLAGAEGFFTLMRRAVALARTEVPSLTGIAFRGDGCLEELSSLSNTDDAKREAGTVIVAHFLGLLVAFIGEPLTLQLLRESWPDLAWNEQSMN